jgi:hypothetical protein
MKKRSSIPAPSNRSAPTLNIFSGPKPDSMYRYMCETSKEKEQRIKKENKGLK